jgi:high frequency lysogenization protein
LSSVDYHKRVIALAGLLQSVHMVSTLARSGIASQDAMESSIRSVFVVNPDSISEVFNGTDGLRTGLSLVAELLVKFNVRKHADLLRYGLAVISLERGLAKRPRMARELGARIAAIDEERMLKGSDSVTEGTIAALAEIYESTLSQIEPRISISGQRSHLKEPANINRIRALLLAAVRSAVLWHQVGGRRWQLLLARGQMSQALSHLQ